MRSSFTDASLRVLSELMRLQGELFLKIQLYKEMWKPKNHMARHFVANIRKFGAPRNHWCMRFEAKNQEFKKAAKMSNFCNIPKSVADHWEGRSACILRKRLRAGHNSVQFVAPSRVQSVTACDHRNLLTAIPGLTVGSEISWLDEITLHYLTHVRPCS